MTNIFYLVNICFNRKRNQSGVLVVTGHLMSQIKRVTAIRKDEQSLRRRNLANPSTRNQKVSSLTFKILSTTFLYSFLWLLLLCSFGPFFPCRSLNFAFLLLMVILPNNKIQHPKFRSLSQISFFFFFGKRVWF